MIDELKTVALFLLFTGLFVFVHEKTHESVYQDYNCTDIQVNLVDFNTSALASTQARCPAETMQEMDVNQQNVEATGYQILPLYLLVSMFVVLYMYNEEMI